MNVGEACDHIYIREIVPIFLETLMSSEGQPRHIRQDIILLSTYISYKEVEVSLLAETEFAQ